MAASVASAGIRKGQEIMSYPLISLDVKTRVDMIHSRMKKRRGWRLIIAGRGQKMGFVSVKDLLRGPAS